MIDPVKILLLAVGSVIYLFFLTKMMGNKQISEMSMFDYIVGISIGSIAAEMSTNLEDNPLNPVIAMFVYAFLAFIFSIITDRSVFWRKIITGRTIILYNNGKFYKKNFSKARIDVSDFLGRLRSKGYFDMSQIETAILETNGTISILPKSEYRPLTPNDMSITPPNDRTLSDVVIDGNMLMKNLQGVGKNDKWLMNQIKLQMGKASLEDIFLATVDCEDNLSLYPVAKDEKNPDIFE